MQYIYALINFLILAALLWLFGRKAIRSIFVSRRERISRELDETEALEAALSQPPEIAAETPAESPPADDEALSQLCAAGRDAVAQLEAETRSQCEALHREMLSDVRDEFIRAIQARIAALLKTEPYRTRLQESLAGNSRDSLELIRLTRGDIAYLKTKNTLSVILKSAYPMEQSLIDEFQRRTTGLLAGVGGKPDFQVKVEPSLMGGFQLYIGDTVYGCSVDDELYYIGSSLGKYLMPADADVDTLVAGIAEALSCYAPSVHKYQRGHVLSVSDGICWMDGLADIMYGEVVEFECGERGMVLDIEQDRIGCVIYEDYDHIESGSRVRRVGRIASVVVGEALLGRVVDPLGKAMDGRGRIWSKERRPIEFPAPGIPDRSPVSRPLHTGLKAIDALVPIGRGQRELIIGDRQTGKTAIAVDAIINQKGKDTVCIYVAIGQKDTTVAEIRERLERCGAMSYTTIVCAPASSSASLQYIAPFAGCAMAEYFMFKGQDVLIVYDDLSKHAVAYRELSLLLHRPSGREAYPSDVFYLHARLLERSAQLSEEAGGGSITALPIIETQAGDISAFIPTNVISITDGQIFLESDLFHEGQRPAVNVGLSVSRVGGAAQTALMKQASASLRMKLAQYRELQSFSQFSSEVDVSTKKILSAGERMMAALRQGRYQPLPDWKQAVLLLAVSEGFADSVAPADMELYEERLWAQLEDAAPALVQRLQSGRKLDENGKAQLFDALRALQEEAGHGQSA